MAAKTAPQHWISEWGREYRIPSTLDRLAAEGVLEDSSWHNDVAPSFRKITKRKYEIRMWINHPDPAKRDTNEKRFYVSVDESDTSPDDSEVTEAEHNGIGFSDFDGALAKMLALIENYS